MSVSQQPPSGDPFEALPPELRLELLVNLHSRSDVINAARASPALHHQSKHPPSVSAIRRSRIMRVFPEDEDFQNALYFICAEVDNAQDIICDISKRGDCRCPDPFVQDSQDLITIDKLDGLSAALESCVEDYVRKAATGCFMGPHRGALRWMRQGFPHNCISPQCECRERGPDVPEVGPDNLTWKERQILFYAFLSFELCYMSSARDEARRNGMPNPTEPGLPRRYECKKPPTDWEDDMDVMLYQFAVMWRIWCWGERKVHKNNHGHAWNAMYLVQ